MAVRQPSFFIPHGGGPCFFMPDPKNHWTGMERFLRSLPTRLPELPTAIIVVSAHWETRGFRFTATHSPSLIFDYSGFPPETYAIRYDVPGASSIAATAADLLQSQGCPVELDHERGLDHGVFVPLKVAFPEARVPVIEMSVERDLDPALHLAAGKALTPLRDQGVVIIASGMSFHNLRAFGDKRFTASSQAFDTWLTSAATQSGTKRAAELTHWTDAPGARVAHPRAEHLLPLMVAAGTSDTPAERIYSERVLEMAVSGFRFA